MENPQTRKIVYALPMTDIFTTFKFGQYKFQVDKNLNPIPVEVPESIAKLLLEMLDKSCRCHWKPPQHMFREVT